MKKSLLVMIILTTLLAACSPAASSQNPGWVDQLIKDFKNQPVGNPPLSIWRYDYQGQVVYFVPAHCCDIPSVLYDDQGNVLCSPDGGIAGRGDERCPDFFSQRSNEQLIWKDNRSN